MKVASNHRPLAGRLKRWVIYLFLFCSLSIFLYALALFDSARQAASWPSVSGTVVSARVVGVARWRKPQIRYVYTVGEKQYTGSRIMIGPGPGSGGPGIPGPAQYVRRYGQGRPVTVYFDAEDPVSSVLEPGVNRVVVLILLIGIFFSLLGLFMRQVARQDLFVTTDQSGPQAWVPNQGESSEGNKGKRATVHLDGTGRLLGLLLPVLFIGIVGYIFWPKYHPLLEQYGIVQPDSPRSERTRTPDRRPAPPTVKQADPAAEKVKGSRHVKAGDKPLPSPLAPPAKGLSVSIGADFVPARGILPSSWEPDTKQFYTNRPEGIVKEPAYQGKTRRYGRLVLGTGENRIFLFVFDRIEAPHPVLYIDRNQNGDLSDDGGPMQNQGTGRFATEVVFPIGRLVRELGTTWDFKLWFFINDASWTAGHARHYSRTQMKGRIMIDGRSYLAGIAERQINDADFTNDGIYIDLDGSGKFSPGTEFVGPGQTVQVGNSVYRLDVGW
ncbi:MAG: DUF3592 domain-containing protein [Desulfobacterales bacterium]|nr:DUF3592 domain-containing protein [Desulfobacterales bacterium]